MKVKQSVMEAMQRAEKHSAEYPDIPVWVVDKPRKQAVVCASEFVCRNRIMEGWVIVAEYKAGKRRR